MDYYQKIIKFFSWLYFLQIIATCVYLFTSLLVYSDFLIAFVIVVIFSSVIKYWREVSSKAWEDDIRIYLRLKDRDYWRDLVNVALNLRIS